MTTFRISNEKYHKWSGKKHFWIVCYSNWEQSPYQPVKLTCIFLPNLSKLPIFNWKNSNSSLDIPVRLSQALSLCTRLVSRSLSPPLAGRKHFDVRVIGGRFACATSYKIQLKMYTSGFNNLLNKILTKSDCISYESWSGSMNVGKSSQLESNGFGSLHSLTWSCYNNEDILLQHWLCFTNDVE